MLVEGVNRAKKHVKPNPMKGVAGGIMDKDMPIHLSNVALFNHATKKADRVGFKAVSYTHLILSASWRTLLLAESSSSVRPRMLA